MKLDTEISGPYLKNERLCLSNGYRHEHEPFSPNVKSNYISLHSSVDVLRPFLFRTPKPQISDRRPAVIVEVFYGFPQCL